MDKQVRTAKALVGIDEVHFLKHVCGEPTITQYLIDGLDETGVNPLVPGWFSVASVRGSVEVTQDPVSKTAIHIDQSDMPVGISTEPGDFNINLNMPDLRENLFKWLDSNKDDAGYTPLRIGNASGYGFDFNAELIDLACALKTKTGEWFIFPSIQGSVALQQVDNVMVLHFEGMVLGAANEANNDIYILSNKECNGGGGDDDPSGDPSGDPGQQ